MAEGKGQEEVSSGNPTMISLHFHFPAHRYHATPWGRHVNEAEVAWPPDLWRVLRAFIAIWRRKLDPTGEKYRNDMRSLLGKLTSTLPHYYLPPAIPMHTRHYMPVREGKADKPVLIFDAALHIADGEPVIISWPVELNTPERGLLRKLAENLNYLGRAESWTEVIMDMSDKQYQFNCVPIEKNSELVDPDTGELLGERVHLLVPRTPKEYLAFRDHAIESVPTMKPREKKRFLGTLPEDWLDALCIETDDLRTVGWSVPPAAKEVDYRRPVGVFEGGQRQTLHLLSARCTQPTTLRYALLSKPLPVIEQAVRVGEWARIGAMGRAKREFGENDIPWQISGHGTPEDNRHGHAFFLPDDADGDGYIDHLLIHVPAGIDERTEKALRGLSYLKDREGNRIQLFFEGLGSVDLLHKTTPLLGRAYEWESVTPYLYPWHLKLKKSLISTKRVAEAWRQIKMQFRRECRKRGLPEPIHIEIVEKRIVAGRRLYPIHFHRFRSKRGLTQPDRTGRFLRIRFSEPVSGPLAFGFGCHFGLGLFIPIGVSARLVTE